MSIRKTQAWRAGTPVALLLSLGLFTPRTTAQEPIRSYEGVWSIRGWSYFERGGDVDGDGHWDLITGESPWSEGGVQRAGRARLLSGATGEVIRTYEGSEFFEQLGLAVAVLPDVSGDGIGDYAISSDLEGVVYSGADHSRLVVEPWFARVAPAGDLNHDGIEDFLLTQSYSYGGEVHVYHGGTFERAFDVFSNKASFGLSIVAVDDLDGDGVTDFAVGAPAVGFKYDGIGHVEVFSGADGHRLYELPGIEARDRFGNRLEAPGDVNGDGIGDLVVETWCCGALFFDGPTGTSIGNIPRVAIPTSIGDVNGNGFSDLVMGVGDRRTWTIGVFDGGTRKTIYEIACSCGPYDGIGFGKALARAGDLDGDEVPDFLVVSSGTVPEWGRIDVYPGIPRGQRLYGEGCARHVRSDPAPLRPAAAGLATRPATGLPAHPRIGADPVDRREGVARFHLSRVDPDLDAFLIVGRSAASGEPGRFAGCPVHVAWDGLFGTTTHAIRPGEGAASVEVALPPELTGTTLHAQWFVRHPRPGSQRALWSSSRALALDVPGWAFAGPEGAR